MPVLSSILKGPQGQVLGHVWGHEMDNAAEDPGCSQSLVAVLTSATPVSLGLRVQCGPALRRCPSESLQTGQTSDKVPLALSLSAPSKTCGDGLHFNRVPGLRGTLGFDSRTC